MTAITQVGIINMALGHLKQRPITAITDLSVQAQVANIYYEPSRREALRGNSWSFATCVNTLSLLSNYTPTTNWAYAYSYPSNAVAIWRVYDDSSADKSSDGDFRVLYDSVNNQKVIVSNSVDAYAEYTYDLSDTSLFDANFVTAFAYRLAAAMAPQLTGDDNIAKEMIVLFNNAVSEAQRISSYENKAVETAITSSYEDAR